MRAFHWRKLSSVRLIRSIRVFNTLPRRGTWYSAFASCRSFPPLAPRRSGRSPPPLFPLYQPLRGRCVKSAGGFTTPRTKVELYQATSTKLPCHTSNRFEAELADKLDRGNEDTAAIVRWVSEKVLASYRNGIAAGQKGATIKRHGQSRRRGFARQAE